MHPDSFYETRHPEIILYESSSAYIKQHKENKIPTSLSALQRNLKFLESDKYESMKSYKILSEKVKELEMASRNVSLLFAEKENTKKYPPPIR